MITINPHYLSVPKTAALIQRFDAWLANRPFLVFDFRTLWRSGLSVKVP